MILDEFKIIVIDSRRWSGMAQISPRNLRKLDCAAKALTLLRIPLHIFERQMDAAAMDHCRRSLSLGRRGVALCSIDHLDDPTRTWVDDDRFAIDNRVTIILGDAKFGGNRVIGDVFERETKSGPQFILSGEGRKMFL